MKNQPKIDQDIFKDSHFMDEMPGGFFIYRADEAEELIYANKAMLRIFACDTIEEFRELTGNSFRGIVHPDDLEEIELSIKEQIEKDQYDMDYVEYRIIRKDGEVRWIEDYGHFVHNEYFGDIFYVFVGDATEKHRQRKNEKEKLIQEQLRRLEVIEGLSVDYESIFYADLDKNWVKAYRVSSRFAKTFPSERIMREFAGFDADYIKEWVYPDDRELVKDISNPDFIRQKLSENKTFHLSYRIYRDGKVTYIQLHVLNVGSEEHVSQIVMGYRNIDDEIIQEMQQKRILAEALNAATLANKAKNLFLSNMSHDIRTPMNAIVGFTDLCKKHIREEGKVTGYLDMISEASDQMLQLLNDVLEISRLESEDVHVEETKCSLMDIAHQVQMNMISKAAAKNIALSLDITNLKHDMVSTDRTKLAQILIYLVDNAIKFTKDGGWVTLTVMEAQEESKQSDHVTYQFIVEDNGIGIDEGFLEYIFEPFERERNTTLSGVHGTGLGLTIARRLAEMIGGTIDVSSVVGEGSRFVVTLPLYMWEMSANIDEFGDEPVCFSRPKKILIVDDNEINREIENEVLKDAGFLVDTADDGSIAVEKIRQSKPGEYDLILMDIQMPIMDGYHAAKAIRAMEDSNLAGIPIIAVSANSFEKDKKKALESGMNAHLPKPFDTHHLYKVIRQFLKEDKRIVSLEQVAVRPIKQEEYPLLEDFLYDALYIARGEKMPPKEIVKRPELAIYIQEFGGMDDFCLVAEYDNELIGAVWTRILAGDVKGYGNIGSDVPEFAIAVKKDFRRQGIGTKLMKEMITVLKIQGYEKASLSVHKDNYAYRMYRDLGFQVIKVREEDYLMVLELER